MPSSPVFVCSSKDFKGLLASFGHAINALAVMRCICVVGEIDVAKASARVPPRACEREVAMEMILHRFASRETSALCTIREGKGLSRNSLLYKPIVCLQGLLLGHTWQRYEN